MGDAIRMSIEDGLAWMVIDQPGRKVNVLNRALLGEIGEALGEIESHSDLRGMLISSGKPGQFVAGADLKEILWMAEEARGEIEGFLALGHRVFGRLSRLRVPTVALIEGPCLGGGLELALACDARVAVDDPAVRIGLPEVKLGLIPSWGGTQRLPRLIAPEEAARMVLSGEPAGADGARERGVVDEVCGALELWERAVRLLEREGERWLGLRERRSGIVVGMPNTPPVERPVETGEAMAFEAGWGVMVEGGQVELSEGVRVEQRIAVPLFLDVGAPGRVRAVLERRRG